MTARMTARLTTSLLLMATAFLAFLLLSASPAEAHHRDDHTTGNGSAPATTDTSTTASTESTDTSGTETATTDTSSDTSSSETPTIDSSSASVSGSKGTSGSSGSSGSSGGSNASTTTDNTEKAAAGIAKHGYDPDPVQTASPPATKGPLTCPDYDDGDAGPYDADNCDGTQGLNGNGGNGKCAGCTGKADDKWPGGQYPGDNNNGYECDWNGGIGKGNPAHSRCATTQPPPPPPPPCVDDMTTPQDECNPPPPPCPDMNPDQPGIQCNPPPPPCPDMNPDQPGIQCNPPPPPPRDDDDVLGRIIPDLKPDEREATRQGGPVLPFTGASTGDFLWLALLLIGAGALLLWRTGNRKGANA